MPSISPSPGLSRQKRAVNSESEPDEERLQRPSQGGTPFSETTPDGSKRARLGQHARDDENSSAGSEDDSSSNSSEPHPTRSRRTPTSGISMPIRSPSSAKRFEQNAPPRTQNTAAVAQQNGRRPRDVHRAGAIVRVKLTDFVTYTSAEFFPGPRLNMVIGPNGTGKSTLVCAICLGLGWAPSVLGRAKDAAEFVKQGCDEATIELELAGGNRFRRNRVICRTIKREGNKSTFTIDGKQSTKRETRDLAESFSIQIDNLCQFLPQDRVAEFAALTPVELLYSTQRAAAGTEMVELHDNLKTLRAEQKRVQVGAASEKEFLTNLENRQETQREDVERMKQRTEIKKRIEHLEMARPLAQFHDVHKDYVSLKDRNKKLIKERDELRTQLEPALRSVNDKKAYCTKVEKVVHQKRRLATRGDELAQAASKKMEQLEDQLKDLGNQVEAEKKSIRSDVLELKKLQQGINRIKRQMEEGPVDFDPAEYSEKIRNCTRQLREIEERADEVNNRKREVAQSFQGTRDKVSKSEARLRNLASQSGQQEEKLQRISHDTSRAWKWVKENQHRFEKRVYGPPLVECSVTDSKYADSLEGLMQRNDFLAFTAQTRTDFRILQKALISENHLHDVTLKTCSTLLSQLNSPISDEELHALGFDGWAKDFLAGPEPVLAMLCSENRLHQTPLTSREISDEEYQRMENGPISTWVAGRRSYQVIRRREYGDAAKSTRVRQLRQATRWTTQSVDNETKSQVENEISQGKRELETIQRKMDEIKSTAARLQEERNEVMKQKTELEREKSAKQTAVTNFNALPTKLAQQEEKRKTAHDRAQAVRDRVEALRNREDELHLEKASAAIEYIVTVNKFRKLHEDLMRAEVKLVEAFSDYETLKERNSDVNKMLEEKTSEVDESARLLSAAAQKYKKSREEVAAVARRANEIPGLHEVLTSVKEHTLAQLDADLDSERARLELTGEGSTSIIKEFEDRQRRIDKLKEQLGQSHQKLEELEQGITEIRGRWEPRLDALVQRLSDAFSDSFNRIGCAGQISVDKVNDAPNDSAGQTQNNASGGDASNNSNSSSSDFDQWSIKIEVKFRENESLSVLDSHRQSGGERAVSTIFYLMALQSLSASPFRVVDEINQGMDPRNERMVHGRMVDIACGQADSEDAGGQYFLITPKLLSGLVYKPGMKVLCIVSGEYMPEDYEKVDFQRCVAQMKDVARKRARISKAKGKERMVGNGDLGVEA